MTEAAIVRSVLHTLRCIPETWAMKVHGSVYQDAGTPDILGCHRGRMFALEAKLPGKHPTEIQARTLARWEAAGAIVGVIHSADDAVALLSARNYGQEARS